MLRLCLALGLAASLWAVPIRSLASCQWTWDCSGGAGQCRQVPICGSTLDIPPPRPPAIQPIPPPTIPPIEMPRVPPVGTLACRQTYLCNNMGQCSWQSVCQ
jgi:hypothetical protein